MVLQLERILGSKNSISIFRELALHPYKAYGLTEMSLLLRISKSNILRILKPLQDSRIILPIRTKRKKVYRINPSHGVSEKLYELFMTEKQHSIEPAMKNIVDAVVSQIENQVDVCILFGSVAYGTHTEASDVDLCVVGNVSGLRFGFGRHKAEIHNYTYDEFRAVKDFVVLEALLNGIWYKGDVFGIVSKLTSIPKAYAVQRLQQAKRIMRQAQRLRGPARRALEQVSDIAVGQLSAVLHSKTTLPKAAITAKAKANVIRLLDEQLAREGEELWITLEEHGPSSGQQRSSSEKVK